MAKPAGDIVARMQRGKSLQLLEEPKDGESQALGKASPFQTEAAGGSPKVQSQAAGSVVLRRAQKPSFIKSLGRNSRGSGTWGMGSESARLSRRRGLKEILLQSSGAGGAIWQAAAQKLASTSSSSIAPEGICQEQKQLPDLSPEDLSLALDPLEHEWMLTVAQGEAESILNLMALDPSLLAWKDFVTGFTALHWLAKHGRHEDLIKVITFAEKQGYHVDVNVPTASGGLTPLHLAALQGHEMVIKVLVGAYGANGSLRDHGGRKAWQYLRPGASRELKELSGACEEDLLLLGACNTNNNCRPSRGAAGNGDCVDAGAKGRSQEPVTRLSSFRNMFRQAVAFFRDL